MAGPVYKMFRARWTDAWYQLSKAERDAIFGKIDDKMKQLGGKATLVCDSSWNSEQWLFWGVEEYANTLSELNWFRYCDAEILLGTAMQE